MNYPDSVRFLYALGNEIKTAKFGLERIATLLDALGNPQRRPARFVHVAGTNGKGSVCAMLESGLRCTGLKTGLYTSPHLLEPTERIRLNGVPVSSEEFTSAFEEVHCTAENLVESAKIDFHPTYFETVTAMAFLVFRERNVDIAVLETGLGGRLDATNVVEPELCVITPIDFDHERFLGTSIEAIAGEKAGILKSGVPAILATQRADSAAVIRARSRELDCPLIDAWQADRVEALRDGNRIHTHHVVFECSLAGRHQVGNALTAATALNQLAVPLDALMRGLREAQWPGRLQRLRTKPEIIVDGAHNPAGARALAEYVGEFYRDPKPVLIFGAMRDKAVEEMAGILFPLFGEVIVTAPDQDRSLSPESFLALAERGDIRTAPDLASAVASLPSDRPAFISGSLFLVAEAMRLLD